MKWVVLTYLKINQKIKHSIKVSKLYINKKEEECTFRRYIYIVFILEYRIIVPLLIDF